MVIQPVSLPVLMAALILDYLLADPWTWYHPVQAMGSVIHWGQIWILKIFVTPLGQRLGGGLLTLLLVLGSYGAAVVLIQGCQLIHPLLGMGMSVIILASSLGARSLHRAALEVLTFLEQGELEQARQRLSLYVGRDTEQLDQQEICRALVETVAENTPDGATAPLFYGLIGGPPLAWAYKAVSTLDSMVGYRRAPYTYLGTIPARLEDGLTWLPSRLTVITLAFWSGSPWRFWQQCRRDACADPSPNSGWSEAAFAYTLGIQLGGLNFYQSQPKEKPRLGQPLRALDPAVVQDSVALLRKIMLTWIVLVSVIWGGIKLTL
ncbi:MAG: cobalamin biosynthesis protein CobD [Synechococcaceae cyanobacterium SM2_3_1]|nr:cobalamin biosynthesis protein CobD [Synechococcaceae cyanobacterium SM2_3_1]